MESAAEEAGDGERSRREQWLARGHVLLIADAARDLVERHRKRGNLACGAEQRRGVETHDRGRQRAGDGDLTPANRKVVDVREQRTPVVHAKIARAAVVADRDLVDGGSGAPLLIASTSTPAALNSSLRAIPSCSATRQHSLTSPAETTLTIAGAESNTRAARRQFVWRAVRYDTGNGKFLQR